MRYQPAALDRMREAIGGDAEIFADILQSFVDEAESLSRSLRAAAEANAIPAAGQVAHTIKSSGRDFGDEELAGLCAALEHDAKAGQVDELPRRAAAIADMCMALGADIAAYIRKTLGAAPQ